MCIMEMEPVVGTSATLDDFVDVANIQTKLPTVINIFKWNL